MTTAPNGKPSGKLPSPPPAYTELDPSQQSSSSAGAGASATAQPSSAPSRPAQHQTDHYYGPTPLLSQQQTHILPYYDPRSQYSLAEATSRARWRFIGALFWALLILSVISVICGTEVEIQQRPWRGWREIFGGNGDPWENQ
ncbi:hypothetical protein BDW22DRAFT_362100 [Trametopsis cervina]|nr:hypothetical protein BDW22DRAFT_362100 [Trametopsis cervina]